MADTYGVTPADIAAELPGMYPGGFTANTKPPTSLVTTLISEADGIATLRVEKAIGQAAPDPNAAGAVFARRFIKAWVKAEVVRIAYAGNDPRDVATAAAPYDAAANEMRDSIDALGEQAQDTAGTPFTRTRGVDGSGVRDLLISDATLGYGARGGNQVRPF